MYSVSLTKKKKSCVLCQIPLPQIGNPLTGPSFDALQRGKKRCRYSFKIPS